MKTLISMTSFVKEQYKNNYHANTPTRILNYANFLSLTPEIWQFVPCDSDGNVLEEPSSSQEKYSNYNIFQTIFDDKLYYNDLTEYQQAKERCYFDGFEHDYDNIVKSENIRIWFKSEKEIYINNTTNSIKTLEDLIPYNLPLTATAQKEIGL